MRRRRKRRTVMKIMIQRPRTRVGFFSTVVIIEVLVLKDE